MKHISRILMPSLFAVALVGCEKNELRTSNYIDVSQQAQVKVNFFSPYQRNPTYQIKVSNERVSNSITRYDTPFPGGGLNTGGGSTADYLSINPGSVDFSVSIAKMGTNVDSVTLATTTQTLEGGMKYSLYFSDTANNTKTLLVRDTLSRPDSGFAKYRFVNLQPDLPSADLYVGTVKVASAVAYNSVSEPFTLPTNNASAVWNVRAAGGATNLASYTGTVGATISNQRIYTVIARGYNSITATADNRRRNVSLVYNQ
ncbi:MAG TPA: DUF4397 domain-containing protein [Flavisolibacter sp.]|nr:DUF4397 domain-containing protein [Flavisolibacter sp.]